MTVNPRAIAVQGIGFVAIALATLGLIVPSEPSNTAGVPASVSVRVLSDDGRVFAKQQVCEVTAAKCRGTVSATLPLVTVRADTGANTVRSKQIETNVFTAKTSATVSSVQTVTTSVRAEKIKESVAAKLNVRTT